MQYIYFIKLSNLKEIFSLLVRRHSTEFPWKWKPYLIRLKSTNFFCAVQIWSLISDMSFLHFSISTAFMPSTVVKNTSKTHGTTLAERCIIIQDTVMIHKMRHGSFTNSTIWHWVRNRYHYKKWFNNYN